MLIKSEAVISEVFNIAKAEKNLGLQKKFSILRCLVYQLTLFSGSTFVKQRFGSIILDRTFR